MGVTRPLNPNAANLKNTILFSILNGFNYYVFSKNLRKK